MARKRTSSERKVLQVLITIDIETWAEEGEEPTQDLVVRQVTVNGTKIVKENGDGSTIGSYELFDLNGDEQLYIDHVAL